jgi:hypothetical protein
MPTIDINSDNLVKKTRQLERIRKKAVPFAVRNTINDLAFDVRKNILKKSDDVFTIRQKKFISSRTNVVKAGGKVIGNMIAKVGVFAKNTSDKEKPVINLAQQEKGGSIPIGNIPTLDARGGNDKNLIQKRNRLSRAKVKKKFKGSKKKQTFLRNLQSFKTGKLIVTKKTVFRVDEIQFDGKGDIKKFKKTFLYHKRAKRADLKKKPFVQPAFDKSASKLSKIYSKNVNKQINLFK